MSLETTLARAEANALEADRKAHKAVCPKCSRRRERCRIGEQVFVSMKDALAELSRQRQADKQLVPGQGVLF